MSTRDGAAPPVDEDRELLARVAQQDAAAHRMLFDRYYRGVFSFVQRRLGDPELAEEVTSEVFYEVWRSAARFRGESRPSTWIYGIAHFKCMAESRRRKRRWKRIVIAEPASLAEVPGSSDPVGRVAARADLEQVARVLESLPEEQQDTAELALLEGLPYEEVARRLGVSEGTVKTRVSRIRARLRAGMSVVQ